MADEVLMRHEDDVMVITLNRPAVHNAVNAAMAQGLADALDRFEQREDVRVAVITGAGPSFCAGMDLKAFAEGQVPRIEGRGFAGITERPPRKPLIAAVEGHALAGGFEIVLAADLVVASESARFGLSEVRRGLVAAGGGLMRLARRIPHQLAMEMALTGDAVTAADAHRMGFANRVVAKGQALDAALALATVVARNAPLAVEASKRIVNESPDWPIAWMFDLQRPTAQALMNSADAREGAAAFTQKRPPVWQGR
ncbi:crotonase/enoyl-CoA hydratase family protein [uncultured Pseudacidovorax sp.]|uniref:crotonase/enoyl-CoA hydratase family protein n=1 Tax=uncultured Pseudacidovorax sp. TaxID=679313 RepID=UPI0025FC82A1|nr:crotonase/enoyl-CoA hydratase family protein [uncultured Pseudacidovorax sp.]